MPRTLHRLSLAVLLALLLTAMPAAHPAYAQSIVVGNLTDIDNGGANDCGPDTCSLREAIRLANSRTGANTITFSVAGEIVPTAQLPALTDDGTTIDGGASHTVVLNGANMGDANGLTIRSSNNTIRGLVIYNFLNTGDDFSFGAGIYINGAPFGGAPARGDNNRIYGNWIGINQAGSAAISNIGYGVFLANGASGNIIGADTAADRNVISGNRAGGVRLFNLVSSAGLLDGNSIVGNYIGTTTSGEALPAGLDTNSADGGVAVGSGSRNTVISGNVIGGFYSSFAGAISAGVYVTGHDNSDPNSDQVPTGTTITGNSIGVSRGGVRLANRIGVRVGGGTYGPRNTTIGDASSAAGRNVIAGNGFNGIDLPDTGFAWFNTTIAGNYIGLDANGNRQPNGWSTETGAGAGIFIGRVPTGLPAAAGQVTVGPGNLIGGNTTYGVWVRTGGHIIKGNLFGTNPQGSSSTLATTANGAANIFLENGTGVLVGGTTPADRNIIAFSDSQAGGFGGGILINPEAASASNCDGACVSGGHTIEGNYIGVAADGSSALNPTRSAALTKEGIRLRKTTGNTIRNNVIGGLNFGIALGGAATGSEADSTLIVGNKIGAPASGEIFFATYPLANQIAAPRNYGEGIRLLRGANNTIRANLVAYNSLDFDSVEPYGGIRIGDRNTAASNNVVEDNRVVRNGEFNAWGIVVDTSDNVRLSRNTTQFNAGDGIFVNRGGILLSRGGNTSRAAPTGLAIVAGSPPSLTGSAAGCAGCTVEVFGSSAASEVSEGPVYLTAGTTNGSGNFSIQLPACQRYLTTTVTDAAGNTSSFSGQLDTGSPGPCQPLSFSLGAAANPSRNLAPGATTIYTHTLTNNSAVSLNFTVVITSSQDWATAPALVAVPANSSVDFAVSVRVPPGTTTTPPVPVDTTDVQVFAGLQGSNVVRDTTTPQTVTVVPATPAVSGPLTQQRAGATVTFNHVVTNTGDVAGTFLVGTPTLSGAPGDWSVASFSPSSLTLGPLATGTLDIVVNTPSLASPTAPVTLTFQLSVQGASPPRSVSQSDFITSPVVRSFSFTPRASETATTPAGASVSFTYTLTNTGNAADSFSVSASPPAPVVAPPLTTSVASTPALSNLAPGASAAVTVTYSVPSGTLQGDYTSTITAAATGGASPPAPQARNVTVTVTGGGAVVIAPGLPSLNPVTPVGAGTAVSFTNTLTNTGNAAAPVTIGPVTGAPAGWTAGVISSTCPISPTTLAAGANCSFVVEAVVPLGSPGGPIGLGISATAFNTPPAVNVTATAVNTVTVAVVRGLALAPDGLAASTGPGQPVSFSHTLTNTGNAADSFDLSALSSDPRWTVSVSPTVVSGLAAGAPRTIQVTATPGATVTGGESTTLTLTATGQGGGPSASVSDSATLTSISGGDLSPGGRRNVDVGGTVPFTFTVVNTGTVPLSYTVALSDSLAGWSSAAAGVPTAVVAPGLTTTLTVNVTAPAVAAPGVTNTTTVRLLAGSGAGPTFDTSTAVTGIGPRLGVLLDPETLVGEGRANTTVVFTHTLTNLGSEQGTFQLSTLNSLGWAVEASPDLVTLAPGASLPVLVRVAVKPSAEAGAQNFVRLRATLTDDPTIFDESVDQVSVPLVYGLALSSSQARGVNVGATTSLDSLTVFNRGSAFDIFTLSVTGEDANWDVILGQSAVGVNTGDPARVSVQVKVAAGVPSGTVRNIRIEARSSSDGTVRSSVDLTLTAIGTVAAPPRTKTYLPFLAR